jgi:hypothetical protein
MQISVRAGLLFSGSVIAIVAACNASIAQEPATLPSRAPETSGPPPESTGPQTNMPQITVTAPKQAQRAAPSRTTTAAPARRTVAAPAAPAQTAAQQQAAADRAFTQKVDTFNQKRDDILPKTGTTSSQVNYQDILNAPGGNNQSVTDVLVTQFPGVSKDATSSGELHVRNEHANLQSCPMA